MDPPQKITVDEQPEITGYGLAGLQLGDAVAFLKASKKLSFEDYSPKYYLAIQAVELTAKSFLLLKGVKPETVRAIKHDLTKLFAECERHGLELDYPRARETIKLIAPVHFDYRLRYARPGETLLPSNQEVDDFCSDLLEKTWAVYRAKTNPPG